MINKFKVKSIQYELEKILLPGWSVEVDDISLVSLLYLIGPIKEYEYNAMVFSITESNITFWQSEYDGRHFINETQVESPLSLEWIPMEYKEWMIMNLDLFGPKP